MYTMVLMMAMSGSGDTASFGWHRGGCHGNSCHGVAVATCCAPVAQACCAPVAPACGCHGGGHGFLGGRGHSCHGGGFLGHRSHGCHGMANNCCAPVASCGCTGMVAGGCTGMMMVAPGGGAPVSMPPATTAVPAKEVKPK